MSDTHEDGAPDDAVVNKLVSALEYTMLSEAVNGAMDAVRGCAREYGHERVNAITRERADAMLEAYSKFQGDHNIMLSVLTLARLMASLARVHRLVIGDAIPLPIYYSLIASLAHHLYDGSASSGEPEGEHAHDT